MTLKEIEAMQDDWLTVDVIAENIGFNPQSIRNMAATSPEKLGFPVVVCGHRVKIPREGFLAFARGR